MSTMKRCLLIVAMGAVSATACQKKEEKTEAAPTAAATADVATQPSEITPEQKLEQEVEELAALLDMPEDYLSAAEADINDDNLLTELSKLEKELEEEEKTNPQFAASAAKATTTVAPKATPAPKATTKSKSSGQ